ncbi:MAG: flavin reductase family protein [Candidatus Dormibacteraeota bacterium]|nr:flavin reductase family protein [Candidatus Dormibacteraeota bacterium]
MKDEDRLELSVDSELSALQRGGERAQLYRDLLSSFPAGVTVVTAFAADGTPRGLTLIAFCGVSLEPPLVLVCVDRASNTLPAIQHSGGFTINFIGHHSDQVARLMATKTGDKFARIDWRRPKLAEGGPVLTEDSVAYIECRTWKALEAGDHWIFIGEVMDGASAEGQLPLIFHRRTFVDLSQAGHG